MKRCFMLSGLIGLGLLWNACDKSSVIPADQSSQSTQAALPTKGKGVDCIPCQGGSPPPTPDPPATDAQMEADGQALGCLLAQDNGGAPVNQIIGYNPDGTPIIGPNSIYSVFINTVDNTAWPASYRQGVSEGWTSCFSMGKKAGNCPMIQIVSGNADDGSDIWQNVNYCNWIAGGESAPGPPK